MDNNNMFQNNMHSDKTTDFLGIRINEVVGKSFLFMFAALVITAFAALTTSPQAALNLLDSGAYFIMIIVEFAVVIIGNKAISKNNAVLAAIMYTIYSYLTGYILSVLFMAYTTTSIAYTFFICAGMFGVMAVYGLTTKRDLTGIGSYLMMGIIGIVVASLVNVIFIRSSGFDLLISIVAVLIFVGLTVYDVQKIKRMVSYANDSNTLTLALYGGFELYLDFINLFLRLLRIFGRGSGRRSR